MVLTQSDIESINQDLRRVYITMMPRIRQHFPIIEGYSYPQLLEVPQSACNWRKRLMIVGQQPFGWSIDTKTSWDNDEGEVDALLDLYRTFDLGGRYRATPFWSFSHMIAAQINEGSGEKSFLWSNLLKVDKDGERVESAKEVELKTIGLLAEEIEIIHPDLILFFTGPSYDSVLCKHLAVTLDEQGNRLMSEVKGFQFSILALRTYHPRYLRMAKIEGSVLDQIMQRVEDFTPS
jgi:hypothetical protein